MGNVVLIAVLALAIVWLASAIRVIPENERLVIVRFGKYFGVAGPGLALTVPFVDRTVRVRLDSEVPGWRDLPPERLEDAVRDRVGAAGR